MKTTKTPRPILNPQTNWEDRYFYKKSDVLYQLTFAFCERFIAKQGDRTRDQMIQAARSCKQNIVEGLADGVTSTETMLRLINIARGSINELHEDFKDYLKSRSLAIWDKNHPRFDELVKYCRFHNELQDYQPFFNVWSAEECCNIGITLCRMVDRMISTYLSEIEADFRENGGIKERMYDARSTCRAQQYEEYARLRQEYPAIQQENDKLKAEITRLQNILTSNGIPF